MEEEWDSDKQAANTPPVKKTYDKPYDPNYKKPFVKFKKKEREPEGPPELYKPVCVFANDNPPPEVLERAQMAAKLLELSNYTLRTDSSNSLVPIFEECLTRKELYLPWKDFKGLSSKNYFSTESSKEVAKMFFPGFDAIKDAAKAFLSRNARMVLGQTMKSNAKLLVVWTADGVEDRKERTGRTGFSGHPMSIALDMDMPVFNLQREDSVIRLKQYLGF